MNLKGLNIKISQSRRQQGLSSNYFLQIFEEISFTISKNGHYIGSHLLLILRFYGKILHFVPVQDFPASSFLKLKQLHRHCTYANIRQSICSGLIMSLSFSIRNFLSCPAYDEKEKYHKIKTKQF